MEPLSEQLRQAMRAWTTGVSVVTSTAGGRVHGMTVNSFTSVSLDPPRVTVTLAHPTRTYALVKASGVFAVTILRADQWELSDRFAGRVPEDGDRFAGVPTFALVSGAPLIENGLGFVDCRVVHEFEMINSTLFVGEVLAAQRSEGDDPLAYFNRIYHRLVP